MPRWTARHTLLHALQSFDLFWLEEARKMEDN